MASAAPSLPLFYNGLEPLSSETHAGWKMRQQDTAPFLIHEHAVPITTDEFGMVQRTMPIVFSAGDDPIPLALMGLNEGVNVFMDDGGKLTEAFLYVPAYVRRYPFMLARLSQQSQELSLCFDPTASVIGPFAEGAPLFDNGQPTEATREILAFAEQFEQAGQRTQQFVAELKELDLLIEGETTIHPDGAAQPFVYRGFQMINEEKLQNLRGDQLRKMMQNGMLPLIHAHLFSLSLMRDVFARQAALGKAPVPQLQTA